MEPGTALAVGPNHTREAVPSAQLIHSNAAIVTRLATTPESVGPDYPGKYLHRIPHLSLALLEHRCLCQIEPSRHIQRWARSHNHCACPLYDKLLLLTISMYISSANGSHYAQVLPDSGADISAARQQLLQYLNEHVNNLLPSVITPRAANEIRCTH